MRKLARPRIRSSSRRRLAGAARASLGGVALAATIASVPAQGMLERVSVSSSGAQADGASSAPSLSADGRYVVFASRATNLDPAATSGTTQVYLRDRIAGTTELISKNAAGIAGDGTSDAAVVSDDGRFVAYETIASNLLPYDVNGFVDIYLYDRASGTQRLVTNGFFTGGALERSWCPAISRDGRWIAFYSMAGDVVSPTIDTNGYGDAFVYEVATGATQLVSVDTANGPANGGSGFGLQMQKNEIAVASNPLGACFVAFRSEATDLVASPANPLGAHGLYRRDMRTGTTELVSVDVHGAFAMHAGAIGPNHARFTGVALSADGSVVAFDSDADELVAADADGRHDTFARDLSSGATAIVSVSSQQAPGLPPGPGASPSPRPPSISADGRLVAFETSTRRLVPEDASGANSIFVRDVQNDRTRLADVGATGDVTTTPCGAPAISSDGRFVAFESSAPLVPGDTNAVGDVFVTSFASEVLGYCFGDGVDAGTTPCPCANGAAERGCESSLGNGGALLRVVGELSIANDGAILAGDFMPNSTAIYLQGTSALAPSTVGIAFGDGLRCVGGSVIRFHARANSGGSSRYPGPSDPSVSAAGLIAAPGVRFYQCWYRNPAAYCTSETFNLSNGVQATWGL